MPCSVKMTSYFITMLFCLLLNTACIAVLHFPLRLRRAVNSNTTSPNLFGTTTSGYYISIELGTPPQLFNVIVDTGSSNFAIAGAPNEFVTRYYDVTASTTAVALDSSDISITYTEGSWRGSVVNDVLTIPSAGVTKNILVPLAVIKSSNQFFVNASNWEGILGLGYHELVQPQSLNLHSVMESIVESGKVTDLFGMQLCSVIDKEDTQGSLIIGGINKSLALDPIEWTRVVHEWYYDVVIVGMKVGGKMVNVECTEINNDRTIVDSGTSNLRLPTKVYNIVIQMIKEAVTQRTFHDDFYSGAEMFCSTDINEVYSWFPNITIYLPSTETNKTIPLVVYPQNYLQYTISNDALGFHSCVKFAIFPSNTGTVLGTVVMEQYYVVFNRSAGIVGFARSTCGYFPAEFSVLDGITNSTSCRFIKSNAPSAIRITTYVLLGLLALCIIPICILCVLNNFTGKSCCTHKSNELSDTSGLLPFEE